MHALMEKYLSTEHSNFINMLFRGYFDAYLASILLHEDYYLFSVEHVITY